MSRAGRPAALSILLAVVAAACGPRHVVETAVPRQELIILLPDPDGAIGRASVSNSFGSVDLAGALDATGLLAGRPPTPVMPMAEADVQRIAGDALSVLPLPSRVFVLRFGFDSDELTAEARALIPEILRVVGERPAPEAVVVGHTDTTGASAANFDLGLKRAETVRGLLLQAGLGPSFIETTSHGEADPLVPTADATAEPLNRRVEITVR